MAVSCMARTFSPLNVWHSICTITTIERVDDLRGLLTFPKPEERETNR